MKTSTNLYVCFQMNKLMTYMENTEKIWMENVEILS